MYLYRLDTYSTNTRLFNFVFIVFFQTIKTTKGSTMTWTSSASAFNSAYLQSATKPITYKPIGQTRPDVTSVPLVTPVSPVTKVSQLPLAFDKPLPLLEEPSNHLKHQQIIENMWKKMVVLKNVDSYLNDVKRINDFNIYYEENISIAYANQKTQWSMNAIAICASVVAMLIDIPNIFVLLSLILLMATCFVELCFFCSKGNIHAKINVSNNTKNATFLFFI